MHSSSTTKYFLDKRSPSNVQRCGANLRLVDRLLDWFCGECTIRLESFLLICVTPPTMTSVLGSLNLHHPQNLNTESALVPSTIFRVQLKIDCHARPETNLHLCNILSALGHPQTTNAGPATIPRTRHHHIHKQIHTIPTEGKTSNRILAQGHGRLWPGLEPRWNFKTACFVSDVLDGSARHRC